MRVRTMDRKRLAAVAATLSAATLWGTSFPVIKVGLETVNPYSFLAWRFIAAAVLMLLIHLSRRGKVRHLINRRTLLVGFILSLSFLFQYIGQVTTTAAEAAVLLNTGPIIVPVLAYYIINEKLSPRRWPAVVAGIAGIVLTSGVVGRNGISSSLYGALFLLLGALFTSVYIVVTKKQSGDAEPVELFTGSFVCAAIFVTLYAALTSRLSASLWFDTGAAASVLYLAILCTIVPFLLWFRGLRGLTATASTVITLFEPVVSILISVFILEESFTLFAFGGTILIFAAILWMSL
jgi:drug/metabolite transporter (DMT)-like permease